MPQPAKQPAAAKKRAPAAAAAPSFNAAVRAARAPAPAELPVHPLVVGLAASEPAVGAGVVVSSALALECARVFQSRRPAGAWGTATADWRPMTPGTDVNDFTVGNPDTYVLVAGYLGGTVGLTSGQRGAIASAAFDSQAPGQNDQPMRVLYLDAGLVNWLLVEVADIALFNRANDASAAFGLLDVLWLRNDARVVSGDHSQSVRRNYLNGPFVRAEDYASSVSSSTYPRSPGLLLEASSPGCCKRTIP
jgi:hypothetical protein